VKRDIGGALQTGELKGAPLPGPLLVVAFLGAPLPLKILKEEGAVEAARGDGEPGRHGFGSRVPGPDEEAPDCGLVGLDGGADLVGV